MDEKVSSQNRERKISNYEYPTESTVKYNIQGHGLFIKVEVADLRTAWRIIEAGLRLSAAEGGRTCRKMPYLRTLSPRN